MKMIIDNTGLSDQYGQSLLETPSLTSPFTGYYSYLSYDSNNQGGSYKGEVGNVYINNAGPDLAWVAPGSRAIFMTTDKSSAYAGYIFFTPGQHSSQSSTDSAIIPVGTSAQLYFSTPYTQPGFDTKQGGSRIPDGKYMMYVYINGYDEEGHTMLSTEYFGIVRVYSR